MKNTVSRETKYELISRDENGNEVRKYPNGAIRNQRGRLLELPAELESHLITSDSAHDMHKLRKQKILDAIENRVTAITRANTPAEAIAQIVGKRAQIAMRDNTRVGNEAAKLVLLAMDAMQERQQQTVIQRHEYSIDPETMALIEQIAQNKREAVEIIDAEANETI